MVFVYRFYSFMLFFLKYFLIDWIEKFNIPHCIFHFILFTYIFFTHFKRSSYTLNEKKTRVKGTRVSLMLYSYIGRLLERLLHLGLPFSLLYLLCGGELFSYGKKHLLQHKNLLLNYLQLKMLNKRVGVPYQ